jgi:signal transduction histidine kinase
MFALTVGARGRLRFFAGACALASVYVATALIGLRLDPVSGFATLVWAPTGLSLFALVRFGPRLWPGVALGAFLANGWIGAPAPVALGIALGNTLEAVLAAVVLRRLGMRCELDRVRDVILLITVAALAAPIVSATGGALSLTARDLVGAGSFASTWLAWWLGDAIGVLLVAPPLLTWSAMPWRRPRQARVLEAIALFAVAMLVCGFVFFSEASLADTGARRMYLLFPPLLWAGLRFDQRGLSTLTLLISIIAIGATASDAGPFAGPRLSAGLFALQSFMAVVAVTFLLFGAIVAERTRARDAALAAVRARDDFLSIASHELRTPLSSIVLDLDAMRRALPSSAAPDSRESARVQRVARQADRLAHLVDALFDVSRISSGAFTLSRERTDLIAVARAVIARFAEQARAASAPIELRGPDDALGWWDPLRLDQVLANLLSNALHHGAGRPVDVAIEGDETHVRVRVVDRGPGVAPAIRDRIFDRFDRGGAARERGGLGLGLFIARRIVEAHGGSIRLSSESGSGSTFEVELPRGPGEPVASA